MTTSIQLCWTFTLVNVSTKKCWRLLLSIFPLHPTWELWTGWLVCVTLLHAWSSKCRYLISSYLNFALNCEVGFPTNRVNSCREWSRPREGTTHSGAWPFVRKTGRLQSSEVHKLRPWLLVSGVVAGDQWTGQDYQKTIISGIVSVMPVIFISLLGLTVTCSRVCLHCFPRLHDSFLYLQEVKVDY